MHVDALRAVYARTATPNRKVISTINPFLVFGLRLTPPPEYSHILRHPLYILHTLSHPFNTPTLCTCHTLLNHPTNERNILSTGGQFPLCSHGLCCGRALKGTVRHPRDLSFNTPSQSIHHIPFRSIPPLSRPNSHLFTQSATHTHIHTHTYTRPISLVL